MYKILIYVLRLIVYYINILFKFTLEKKHADEMPSGKVKTRPHLGRWLHGQNHQQDEEQVERSMSRSLSKQVVYSDFIIGTNYPTLNFVEHGSQDNDVTWTTWHFVNFLLWFTLRAAISCARTSLSRSSQ